MKGKVMSEEVGKISEEGVGRGEGRREIEWYMEMMKKKMVMDGLEKKVGECIGKEGENEELVREGEKEKGGFWGKVWGGINGFGGRKRKMVKLGCDKREGLWESVKEEIERERE